VPNQESKEIAQKAARVATEASWSQTRVILRIIIIVLIVAITLWLLVKLTGVILLLVLSIFFAYFVSPLVVFLSRPIRIKGRQLAIPRALAIALSYLILVAVIVVGIYILAPRLGSQFPEFTEQARDYWTSIGAKTQGFVEYFRKHRMPGPLLDAINGAIPTMIERVGQTVSAVETGLVGWLA
jgi:predicted PurR-regulated permease PerM